MKLNKRIVALFAVAILTITGFSTSLSLGFWASDKRTRGAVLDSWWKSQWSAVEIKYIGAHNNDPARAKSLINPDGTVNGAVMHELKTALDKAGEGRTNRPGRPDSSNDGLGELGYREWHAGDFSKAIIPETDPDYLDKSGMIFVKLFPTIPTSNHNVNMLSQQWFQVVYRSAGNDKDVLTFYAAHSYRTSVFNSNSNITNQKTELDDSTNAQLSQLHGGTYTNEGNYSTSILRHNTLTDWRSLNQMFGSISATGQGTTNYKITGGISDYFVAPGELPGLWQSSESQTGTNTNGKFFDPAAINFDTDLDFATEITGRGACAIGDRFIPDPNRHFYINNGMDDQGAGYATASGWEYSQIQSCYTDKMWHPSAYETGYMGTNKEKHAPEDNESCINSWATGSLVSRTDDFYINFINRTTDFRHGLWQLNGHDRAFNTNTGRWHTWFRNSRSSLSYLGGMMFASGLSASRDVDTQTGVRPAFHFDLAQFDGYPQTANNYNDIHDLIDGLETEINNLNTKYKAILQKKLDKIKASNKEIDELLQEIADLKSSLNIITVLESQIEKLEEEIKDLDAQIEQLRITYGAEVENLPEYIALVAERDTLQKQLDNIGEQVDSYIEWLLSLEAGEENPNKGIDPKWIGLIVACVILGIGFNVMIVMYVDLRRRR